MTEKWTTDNIPDLTGKVIIVTGANSGLGFESSRAFAEKNATVVMAVRNMDKGEAARTDILKAVPDAKLDMINLDMSSLDSVREFAETFKARYDRLDVLLNNAGLMAIPRQKTVDGFEMQLGVNHLGHFALTGRLLPALLNTPGGRVVTVSSNLHRSGNLDFDDLNWELDYNKWPAYGRSKLANLLFAYELDRKFQTAEADVISVAAHPGYAATNLQFGRSESGGGTLNKLLMRAANALLAQSATMGALPQLYAATAPDVRGGEYYGPAGYREMRGYPARVRSNERSYDPVAAARLWQWSVEKSGVDYALLEEMNLVPDPA